MTRGNEARSDVDLARSSRAIEAVPFGPYRLVARLGVGGAATVFLATREDAPERNRTVVLKRLHEHLNDDPASRATFVDEARILSKLEHPGIVSVIDVGAIEGRAYFAMPYLEGKDLAFLSSRIASAGATMPAPIAARLVADALAALDYAHEFVEPGGERWNLVHRDISPQNMFVTVSGDVRLLDFGIAKATMRSTHTRTGVVKGTFAYIAPEQARGLAIDRRADLWSMGVVLWELVAGERLFAATNEFATLSGATVGPVPRLADALPGAPAELDAVASKALVRDVERRYASAAAMRDDLLAYLETHPASTDDVRGFLEPYLRDESSDADVAFAAIRTPTGVSGSRKIRRNRIGRLLRRGGVAIAVVLAVVVAFVLGGLPRSNPTTAVRAERLPESDDAQPSIATPPGSEATRASESSSEATTGPMGTANAERRPSGPAAPTIRPISDTRGVEPAEPPTPTPTSDAPATVAVAPASLSLVSVPWANVSLDGRDLGTTPILRHSIAPGSHELVLVNPELDLRRVVHVDASPAEDVRLHIRLTP